MPEPDYRRLMDNAIAQRDSALAQLNRRANVLQIIAHHDALLASVASSIDRLQALEDQLARRIVRLTTGLGDDDV